MNEAPTNPAGCKTGDKNYIYWAARDQVFRFRYDPDQPIYSKNEWNGGGPSRVNLFGDTPAAPEPSEPKGCYGNPLVGTDVPYMEKFAAKLFRGLVGREKRAGTDAGAYMPVKAHLRGFVGTKQVEKVFRASTSCWVFPSGITECLLGKRSERDDYRIHRALKIPSVLLSKNPEVHDLYLTIGPDTISMVSPAKDDLMVDVEFDLYEAVRLRDAFRMFPGEIDLLIPYFQKLIPYVTDAHLPGYRWASINAPKVPKK